MGNTAATKGYTRIDNQLLLAICNSGLSLNEIRVLLAIARLSYGWVAEDTGDRAGITELENITGLFASRIYLAIKSLKKRKALIVVKDKRNTYKINTCVSQWEPEMNRCQPKADTGNDLSLITNHNNEVTSCYSNIVTTPDSNIVTTPDSNIVTTCYQKTRETTTFDAARQTPKEIKEIKERKERKKKENLPSDYYQKTLKALGLPATAILAPADHQTLIGLFEENCNFDDIKAARIRRKKNKLSWIQDTVCEERDKRLAAFNDLEALQAEADRLYGGN